MRLSAKYAARSLVVAGVVAAGMFAVPGAANAAVSNCSTWASGRTGNVSCNTTHGSEYRAHVKCLKVDHPELATWVNGKWVTAGPSTGTCPVGTFVGAVQHGTR